MIAKFTSKQKLKLLIVLNLIWAVISSYSDFAWLSQVPFYLIPFTAICSLYPTLLTIWYLLKYFDRRIPEWFTFWTIIGCISYGIASQFYFPLIQSWRGITFYDSGSMFWVAVYGLQSLILLKHSKITSRLAILPGITFLAIADLCHYLVPTFLDFTIPGYPDWLKSSTSIGVLLIQILTIITVYKISTRPARQ